jgi:hypothetical protein
MPPSNASVMLSRETCDGFLMSNDEAERAAVFDSLRDEAWQAAGCRGVQWFKVQKSKTFKNL